MNIAILQSFLPSRSNGGVAHFTHQLAEVLIDHGHDITIFSLDPAPQSARYQVIQPAPGTGVVKGRLGRVFGFGVWLARQDYSSFDAIHAMGDNHFLHSPAPVVRTISGSALAEAWHAPKLMTRLMYLFLYPLELLGVARSDIAVGISRNSNAYHPGVKAVIPQGINLSIFTPSNDQSSPPSILFVGHRLRDRKRGYLLLEAFQRTVQPVLPEAELWLVCDDQVEAPGVRQFSNLPIETLAELYRQAWVFCLPSSYEGFGRPYAEAMACGTPVVATPNPGALEVLEQGRYGIITPIHKLGQTLLDLLADPDRRQMLGQAGLHRARAFNWETVARQYEEVYAAAIAKKDGAKSRKRNVSQLHVGTENPDSQAETVRSQRGV